MDEVTKELEEFQLSSRELEQELETLLKQEEKRNKELSAAHDRLANECESLRVCFFTFSFLNFLVRWLSLLPGACERRKVIPRNYQPEKRPT